MLISSLEKIEHGEVAYPLASTPLSFATITSGPQFSLSVHVLPLLVVSSRGTAVPKLGFPLELRVIAM